MRELTGKLKNGKAGGSYNILPEMIKTAYGTNEFRALSLDPIHTEWEETQVETQVPRE